MSVFPVRCLALMWLTHYADGCGVIGPPPQPVEASLAKLIRQKREFIRIQLKLVLGKFVFIP